MPINTYLNHLQIHLLANNATEHTHRPALQNLLTALLPHYRITNEPRRIACGSPDFEIAQGDVPIGHIEAKDIGIDLDKMQQSKQLQRYLPSLHNLILTDYLEFRWFVNSEYQADMTVVLAEWDSKNRQFITYPEQFSRFETLITTFIGAQIITLRSPEELAKKMAHIARLMNDVMFRAYQQENSTGKLHGQLESFRKVLIDTLTPEQFADMVAQTICYGLFAAKCGAVGQSFSRLTASYFVPKTNPFLRNLFNQIAGIELDERLVWMVDHLVAVLNRANIGAILENFGKRTRQEDPVVHFYETFLAHYDAKLREVRGVYYTPEPVVSYIVRSVDWVLKNQFRLKQGLADNSTLTPNPSPAGRGVRGEGIIHKVQILDPATGTGTFLYTVIANIYERFRKNQGMWSDYVSKHLLPRVHGFELLMAAYTVAHMKLSLQLKETGYDFSSEERLQVFLTNTLDEPHYSETSWLAKWLSEEANAASGIKQHSPVMVILGNPPYSYDSMNKGDWINQLIRDYYQIDGQALNERNSKGLQDDYVKFIRFAQWRIQQTGYGVLGFVTNHSYLDNPTFRGMRQALMQDFDEIYILDLHGNSKKKEKSLDGSVDKNVFDIQQGVAIGIFVKHKLSPPTPLSAGEGSKEEGDGGKEVEGDGEENIVSLFPSPSGRGVRGEGKEGKIPPLLLNRARELRKNLTDAEQILWSVLRGQRFLKLKFRRQHPISPYILDFYCHELKLAIEVDGGQHNTSEIRASDTKRTLFLFQLGITVLRFWNNEVIYQFDAVLEAIYFKVLALQEPSPLTPLPEGEGNKDTIFSLSPSSISALPTSPSSSPPSPRGRGVGGEGNEDKNAKVYHTHLFGERAFKYQYLMENDIKTTQWTTLQPQSPFYLFVPQNTDLLPEYEKFWQLTKIFISNANGVKTNRDHLLIDFDKNNLVNRIMELSDSNLPVEQVKVKYELEDGKYWNTERERNKLQSTNWIKKIISYQYRPFDIRNMLYMPELIEIGRGGACKEVMLHMLNNNLCISVGRQGQAVGSSTWDLVIAGENIADTNLFYRGGIFCVPLYLYPTEKTDLFASPAQNTPRKPNFSNHFIHALETSLKLQFIPEGQGDFNQTISALDVFHYMYAVFHSPTYRQRYAEFLKIDFPHLPLTSDKTLFKQLADLGEQLVNIHLMETDLENDCNFPIKGDNLVEKLVYKNEKVYINKTQYFDNVKPKIWEFHIGGYQVCEKWLKDRKGRTLSFEDCLQYLYILAAIEKTQEVMEKIDEAIGEFPLI